MKRVFLRLSDYITHIAMCLCKENEKNEINKITLGSVSEMKNHKVKTLNIN